MFPSSTAALSDDPEAAGIEESRRRSISWPLTLDQADTIVRGIDIQAPLSSPFDASLSSNESPWVFT